MNATTEIAVSNFGLKVPARRLAAKAIESVHLAYYEKGGIRDTAAALTGQLLSAGQHVFALARHAAKENPKSIEQAASMFADMCEYAEQTYKSEHDVDNLREALPTWATYKSNVLRGLRAGLNPLEHKTEKVYRSKTMELVSRTRTHTGDEAASADSGARAGSAPRMQTEQELVGMVSTTAIPDTLKQLVAQVVYAAEVVNVRRIEQAEEILREAWQKLGALTDKRKLKG